MTRLSRSTISTLLGTVMLTAACGSASAHMIGGGHGPGGHFGGHFGHHFHGSRGAYFVGFDDGDYGYDNGCGYLRYKAHETGRPYWWRRYHACLDD